MRIYCYYFIEESIAKNPLPKALNSIIRGHVENDLNREQIMRNGLNMTRWLGIFSGDQEKNNHNGQTQCITIWVDPIISKI